MYVAVDIGGTKTTVASFATIDPAAGLDSVTYATPKDYTQALSLIKANIVKLQTNQPLSAVGISVASRLTPDYLISNSNNLAGYNDQDLAQDLKLKINKPVYIQNDAACAALAEITYGNGKGKSSILHFILGTGFGGAYATYYHKFLVLVPLSPGSVIIDPNGMPHTHKQVKGLFESYLGGGQIEAQVNQPLKDILDNHLIWQRVSNYLALAAYNFCKLFSAEIVTLSGGLIEHRLFLIDQANQSLENYPKFFPHPHLILSSLKGNPSLIGALTLCQE